MIILFLTQIIRRQSLNKFITNDLLKLLSRMCPPWYHQNSWKVQKKFCVLIKEVELPRLFWNYNRKGIQSQGKSWVAVCSHWKATKKIFLRLKSGTLLFTAQCGNKFVCAVYLCGEWVMPTHIHGHMFFGKVEIMLRWKKNWIEYWFRCSITSTRWVIH